MEQITPKSNSTYFLHVSFDAEKLHSNDYVTLYTQFESLVSQIVDSTNMKQCKRENNCDCTTGSTYIAIVESKLQSEKLAEELRSALQGAKSDDQSLIRKLSSVTISITLYDNSNVRVVNLKKDDENYTSSIPEGIFR